MSEETTWSTAAEAIAFLAVSDRSLRRYAASGRIKTLKIGKNCFYDLETWQEKELQKAEADDDLVKTDFLSVIYDSRKNPNTVGRPIIRPSISYMIPGGVTQSADGSFTKTWNHLSFCLGANLDIRMPSDGGLITGDDWNAIAVQGCAKKLLESGELQIFLPVNPEFEASYRSYSQTHALKLVENTWDVHSLERYSQKEDRPVVLAAVMEKRAEIESAIALNRTQAMEANDFRRNFRGAA